MHEKKRPILCVTVCDTPVVTQFVRMVHILQNACKDEKYNEKKYDDGNRPSLVTTSINILLIDIRESAEWNKKTKWNSLEMDLKTVAGIELIWLHMGRILFGFIITYK